MVYAGRDGAQGHPREHVGVVTLTGVVSLSVECDRVEWTATGEHTPALEKHLGCFYPLSEMYV